MKFVLPRVLFPLKDLKLAWCIWVLSDFYTVFSKVLVKLSQLSPFPHLTGQLDFQVRVVGTFSAAQYSVETPRDQRESQLRRHQDKVALLNCKLLSVKDPYVWVWRQVI